MRFARQASPADAPAIAAFDEWHQATPPLIAAGECHIAGEDGRPLAYAILNRSFFHRAWIAYLFVHRNHRRRGFGGLLLDHVERACASDRIWTSTELPNLPMQALLMKRGYHLAGVVENLQKNPELFYYKDLVPPHAG